MTVVRLGAWCDFVTEDEYRERLLRGGWAGPTGSPASPSVPSPCPGRLGRKYYRGLQAGESPSSCMSSLTLLTDAASRCTRTGGSPLVLQWRYLTLDHLERDVRTTVLPDDDDTQDEHPWEWIAELLHVRGVTATAEELRLVPYDVVFSERLRARLEVT